MNVNGCINGHLLPDVDNDNDIDGKKEKENRYRRPSASLRRSSSASLKRSSLGLQKAPELNQNPYLNHPMMSTTAFTTNQNETQFVMKRTGEGGPNNNSYFCNYNGYSDISGNRSDYMAPDHGKEKEEDDDELFSLQSFQADRFSAIPLQPLSPETAGKPPNKDKVNKVNNLNLTLKDQCQQKSRPQRRTTRQRQPQNNSTSINRRGKKSLKGQNHNCYKKKEKDWEEEVEVEEDEDEDDDEDEDEEVEKEVELENDDDDHDHLSSLLEQIRWGLRKLSLLELPFNCPICQATFPLRTTLESHQNELHPSDDDEDDDDDDDSNDDDEVDEEEIETEKIEPRETELQAIIRVVEERIGKIQQMQQQQQQQRRTSESLKYSNNNHNQHNLLKGSKTFQEKKRSQKEASRASLPPTHRLHFPAPKTIDAEYGELLRIIEAFRLRFSTAGEREEHSRKSSPSSSKKVILFNTTFRGRLAKPEKDLVLCSNCGRYFPRMLQLLNHTSSQCHIGYIRATENEEEKAESDEADEASSESSFETELENRFYNHSCGLRYASDYLMIGSNNMGWSSSSSSSSSSSIVHYLSSRDKQANEEKVEEEDEGFSSFSPDCNFALVEKKEVREEKETEKENKGEPRMMMVQQESCCLPSLESAALKEGEKELLLKYHSPPSDDSGVHLLDPPLLELIQKFSLSSIFDADADDDDDRRKEDLSKKKKKKPTQRRKRKRKTSPKNEKKKLKKEKVA